METKNLRGTKWTHKQRADLKGEITFHRPSTGRFALLRSDGKIYRGRVDNLRRNWEQDR